MASPQLENGHIRIANEILDVMMLCKIAPYERAVLDAIIRQTYGWGKKSDWISNSQLSDLTGIPRPHITRTVKMLISKKMVEKDGRHLSFQKDWEVWIVKWRKLPLQVTGVTTTGNKKLPLLVPTKDNKYTLPNTGGEQSSRLGKNMKKNSFKYNENKHQDFDDVIDLETGRVVEDKKTHKHYKEVYEAFKRVLNIHPLNWSVNRTQQIAAENLYTERGLEQIERALRFYEEHKDDEYCPKIASPYDLDSKWSKLFAFKDKL